MNMKPGIPQQIDGIKSGIKGKTTGDACEPTDMDPAGIGPGT